MGWTCRLALRAVLPALSLGLCSMTLISEPAAAAEAKAAVAPAKLHREVGYASYYSGGGRTASGMKHGPNSMTAAHRKLPFGSRVKVKDMKTGREVVVVITDRGPFRRSRVIDLSRRAAQELGIIQRGIAKVEVSAE